MTKTCTVCGNEFTAKTARKVYCSSRCNQTAFRERNREHVNEYSRNTYANRKDYYAKRHIEKTYGLTPEQYQAMTANGCEVCGVTEDLVVDHDHSCCPGAKTCGKCVRGILCQRHNKAEGFLKDADDALALAFYMVKNVNILEEVTE